MFECPNCGGSVEDDSPSCPHCGSDAETGWRPDVDYYSLELPEDDDDNDNDRHDAGIFPEEPALRLRNMVGPGLVTLCFVLFVSAGYRRYDLWILPPAIMIMTLALIALRWHDPPLSRHKPSTER